MLILSHTWTLSDFYTSVGACPRFKGDRRSGASYSAFIGTGIREDLYY